MRDIDAYKEILDDPNLANAEVIDRLSDLTSDPEVKFVTFPQEYKQVLSPEQIETIETSASRLREQRARTAENLRKVARKTNEDPVGTRNSPEISIKTENEPASDFMGDQTANPIRNVTDKSTDEFPIRDTVEVDENVFEGDRI